MLFLLARYIWRRLPWSKKQDEQNVDNLPKDEAVPPEERKEKILWLVRLSIALAIPCILETLDYTVVATAQSRIASSFNRLDLQSYIGTVYLLTSTVFLPLFASLADVYGRHWAMQTSMLFFLFGSALSTGAQNIAMLLAGRGISGIGAAGLLTVVRTILADSQSLSSNNYQAAIMTLLYATGYCIGPVIGGALSSISFRWVFAINLPCCVVSMVLTFILLRKHTKRPLLELKLSPTDKLLHVDWTAAALFTVGGILLLLGLNWGSSAGWDSTKVIVCLVVGALLVGVTIGWEATLEHKQSRSQTRNPYDPELKIDGDVDQEGTVGARRDLSPLFRASSMLPLSVLVNYDVFATNFAAFTSGMVMLVVFYFVSIFFVIVSGQSPTHAGVQLLYFAPGMGVGTVISIQLVSFLRQPKYPIVLGGMIIPIALGLISMSIHSNKTGELKGFMVLAGTGVGMTFGPLALHARFSQPNSRVAVVVALNLFFRTLGGTVGLAQCGTVMNAKVQEYFDGLSAATLAGAGLQGSSASTFSSADLTSLDQIDQLPEEAQEIVRNAFRNGVRWCFISLVPWACASFVGGLFLRKIVDSDRVRGEAPLRETLPTPAAAVGSGASSREEVRMYERPKFNPEVGYPSKETVETAYSSTYQIIPGRQPQK